MIWKVLLYELDIIAPEVFDAQPLMSLVTLRASVGMYNTAAEVEQFLLVTKKIKEFFLLIMSLFLYLTSLYKEVIMDHSK